MNSRLPDNNLKALWQQARSNNQCVVMWSIPKTDKIQFIVHGIKETRLKENQEKYFSGFVISPFFNSNGQDIQFLTADYRVEFNFDGSIISQEGEMPLHRDELVVENFEQYFESKEDFVARVNKAIELIRTGTLQKIVLSRQKQFFLEPDFSPSDFFLFLCKKHPTAFVAAAYIPENNSIWIGASPELLISIDKDGVLKSTSLAATKKVCDPNEIVNWGTKDLDEHRFVSEFIRCRLGEHVKQLESFGPHTVMAGNVWHLQTRFESKLSNAKSVDLMAIVSSLHPSSALCGLPQDIALKYIIENEPYKRNLYTGYWGPFNMKGESNLYANIRCMQIFNNGETILYAGCGITADSSAELEWLETEDKCHTLIQALQMYSYI